MCMYVEIFSCFADVNKSTIQMKESRPLIGGISAPIFFTQYESTVVDSICNNQNNPTTIVIEYPQNMQQIAYQISHEIKHRTKFKIQMEKIEEPQDTKMVQYRHNNIIVFLKFN